MDLQFYKLCKTGNLDQVRQANPSVDLEVGLFGAAKGGHLELVKELINRGATNVNWALQGACQSGSMDLVHLLIDSYGANQWDKGLQGACKGGHLQLIEEMLARGATEYNLALAGACAGGHVALAERFMTEYGADFYNYGAYCAAQDQQLTMVKLMIQKGANRYGELYTVAKEHNDQPMMDYLIKEVGYQATPPPPLVCDDPDDRKRILGLIQMRSPGFCMGLQMGGEVRDHLEDCRLVGLSKEKEDALIKVVDRYMMERHKELTTPDAYRQDLEPQWWNKIFATNK